MVIKKSRNTSQIRALRSAEPELLGKIFEPRMTLQNVTFDYNLGFTLEQIAAQLENPEFL